MIAEILDTAPNIKIMLTSRERLKVQEEWVFSVKGLSYPGQDTANYADFDTIQLFEQRATQTDSDVMLSNADQPFIARIATLVQGNPLAIELAAAWTRMLTCQEIAEAIQRNWDFPSSELRNISERHRSINAVFDYSWQRLSQVEQVAFKKLTVFRGGFSREAALGVAGVTLHLLANLQDKSFLAHGADGRYELHELLHQYGQAKLEEIPEEAHQLNQNFVNYFGKFCQDSRPSLWNAEHNQAVVKVKEEITNIRHAWNLANLSSNWVFFEQSVETLWNYYNDSNLFEEGIALFQRAIQQLAPQALQPTEILLVAWLIHAPAWFAFRLGKLDEAKLLEGKSLTWLNNSGIHDAHIEMMIFGSASFIALALKDFEEATKYADKCRMIGEQDNYETAVSAGHLFHGMIDSGKGDLKAAKLHLYEALHLSEKHDSQWRFAYIMLEIARAELADKNLPVAESFCKKSVDFFFANNDVGNAAVALNLLGVTHLELGDKVSAAMCFYDVLHNNRNGYTITTMLDTLIEIASLLIDAKEVTSAFNILNNIQSHPANSQNSRLRIDATLASINNLQFPISSVNTDTTDRFQYAIELALKAEQLLR